MSTYEIHPPKRPLQRVIERLSIKSAGFGGEGGRGEPEFSTADMAAASAGMGDELGRELIGVMLEDAPAVNHAVQVLDAWGWQRWRIDWPDKQITGALHGRIAQAVVADYQEGGKGYSVREIRSFLKVSGARFVSLTPHWHVMTRRMIDAESALVQHLRRQLRREVA